MEQSNKQERKIVHWKLNNNNWNLESFMEAHPEYKKPDGNHGFNYWTVILALADELGFDEDAMHSLFEKKPEYRLVDLVFAMYLVRLYGMKTWEEFFAYKKTINPGEVHGFIKEHEGLLQDGEIKAEEQDFKDCLKNLKQLLDQHEATRKEYEKAIHRLCEMSEKAEAELQKKEEKSSDESSVTAKNHCQEDPSLMKCIQKLDRENAVLKTQLDAEKREAALKYDAAMELKRIENEHLKEQMYLYLEQIEQMRLENQKLRHKTAEEQIQYTRGFFRKGKTKTQKNVPMDERQKLALKIISDTEYPDFLKVFIKDAYQSGMDLEKMKVFDNPKLEQVNFEMMKSIIERDEKII